MTLHAWMSDVSTLNDRLTKGTDLLHAALHACSSLHALYNHVCLVRGLCRSLLAYCKFYSTGPLIKCSTPLARPQRHIARRHAESASGTAHNPEVTDQTPASMLVLATFGWWEIIEPSDAAIQALCFTLAARGIHVCVVTGLPSASLPESLGGRHGYVWKGPLHHRHDGVGVLVASPWQRLVQVHTPVEDVLGSRRLLLTAPGPVLILAAYGPYVGAWKADLHRTWLRDTLDILKRAADSLRIQQVWITGDFNLRGVAPGPSHPAADGTGHASLAHEFRDLLFMHGITVLPSPATHNRGGALDIHGTNTFHPGEVGTVVTPSPCISDHRVSFVVTRFRLPSVEQQHSVADKRGVVVFDWSRDLQEWQKAWRPHSLLCRDVAKSIQHNAHVLTCQPIQARPRRAVAAATQALIDAMVTLFGHTAGLLRQRACRHAPRRAAGIADHMLNDLRETVRVASAMSAATPLDQTLADHANTLRYWFQQASIVNRGGCQPYLHQSWLEAVRKGEAGIQRWLSSSSQLASPRISTCADSQAASLVDFRARVGRLDPRCDAVADISATNFINDLAKRHTHAMAMGQLGTWIAAPSADLLCHSRTIGDGPDYSSLFVTRPTVRAFINKRLASTGSSFIPWAAFKAAAAMEGDFLELIHASLEITWAVADMDDESLHVELTHAHKGKQKPVDLHSSFRPLGQAHPLMSLRSDILGLRLGPGLACLGGTSQLGGLRDARLAVIARQEAAARRREMCLPNCELSVDARFGYDGGRHCRFMQNVSEATSDTRDWLLCRRLLTGHRLYVRDISDEGCVATLPAFAPEGGGTIQGLSLSSKIYGPIPVRCEHWVSSVVPRACTRVHPMVLKAYQRTRDGAARSLCHGCMGCVATAVRKCERILQATSELTSRDDSVVLFDLSCVMASLSTDAERLMVMDALDDSEAEAATAYVDDLKMRFSSPWALTLASQALDSAARNLGVVYECGPQDKSTISFEGVPGTDICYYQHSLAHTARIQGGMPYILRSDDAMAFLGVPDGAPALLAGGRQHSTLRARNTAVRQHILKQVSIKAAIAMRVSTVQASRCPWPMLARRYYLSRAESKLAYLLPLVLGVQVAGLRVTGVQSRWALAVVTGRTTWAHKLRLPREVRQQLCDDMGWNCLWSVAKAAAIALYEKCRHDGRAFAHARLANDGALAKGGWMLAARRSQMALGIPGWQPEPNSSASSLKDSLRKYRKQIVLPAILSSAGVVARNPPLPWAWIALRAGAAFSTSAFEWWWQIRTLGQPYPSCICPWCSPCAPLQRDHLQVACATFAMRCWELGVLPEKAFDYPRSAEWFEAVLGVMDLLVTARVT